MKKSPLISIAVATYNGEPYIESQIRSLLNQDYENLEIIISDDCSTDNTWEIIRSYSDNDTRVRLLTRDVRRGYLGNFYRVFQECQGEFISPCDQDDIWHQEKTRKLMNNIGAKDLVYCNSRLVDPEGNPIGKTLSDKVNMITGNDPRNFLFGTSVCGHAMLFRRSLVSLLPRADFFPYIDWALAFLASNENGIEYLDEVLVDWRQHSASVGALTKENSPESRRHILETNKKTIHACAQYPGKEQKFINLAKENFDAWINSYFNLSMFFFILKYQNITHKSHKGTPPPLKYLAGHKLKKLLRPNYY